MSELAELLDQTSPNDIQGEIDRLDAAFEGARVAYSRRRGQLTRLLKVVQPTTQVTAIDTEPRGKVAKQVWRALQGGPQLTRQIADQLDMKTSNVSACLVASKHFVRLDDGRWTLSKS